MCNAQRNFLSSSQACISPLPQSETDHITVLAQATASPSSTYIAAPFGVPSAVRVDLYCGVGFLRGMSVFPLAGLPRNMREGLREYMRGHILISPLYAHKLTMQRITIMIKYDKYDQENHLNPRRYGEFYQFPHAIRSIRQ